MRDDFFWALFGGGFIFFWAILISTTTHLRAKRRLRERELIHKERLVAIEKGVPLPEDEAPVAPLTAASLLSLSLAAGLVLLFGGLGLAMAFYFAPDEEYAQAWTVGFVPAMAGLGLLLYVWLGRQFPVD